VLFDGGDAFKRVVDFFLESDDVLDLFSEVVEIAAVRAGLRRGDETVGRRICKRAPLRQASDSQIKLTGKQGAGRRQICKVVGASLRGVEL
jgi:hypothetical protein